MAFTAALLLAGMAGADPGVLDIPAGRGPGRGRHVLLLAGDEEYRSEEMLPQLAKILAEQHGFRATVGFSLNDKGEIDPEASTKQSGLDVLPRADALVIMLRFRRWSDQEMAAFSAFLDSGRPLIALRTSTHAFAYPADSTSPWRKWSWDSREWSGGFGRQILGETWISHWGDHGRQGTMAIPAGEHEVLRGVGRFFGDTDVYEVHPPSDALILLRGQVVEGMTEGAPPAVGVKRTRQGKEQSLNDPMMPVAWLRTRSPGQGKTFVTTMGAATDFKSEGFRRFLVNCVYSGLGMEAPQKAKADLPPGWKPTSFGFGGFRRGIRPSAALQ